MPRTQEKRPRASNGRFVKRARATSRQSVASQGPTQSPAPPDHPDVVGLGTQSRREGSVRLALLSVAILCAALGFAFSFFWIAALVLMGVLWGAMLAERPQRQRTVKGLVTEMVSAVVDEARDVTDGGSVPASGDVSPSPPGDPRTTEG